MPWLNPSYPYRVKITVDRTKISADLIDFPVYVNLNHLPAGFHAAVNQTDGRDIRVTTSDETTLIPAEVVFYNAANDAGELYFKAPLLSSSTNAVFYVYYGDVGATMPARDSTYGSENVWDSDYLGVWHLKEVGTGAVDEYKDSTVNKRHGRGGSGTVANVPVKVAGKLGDGQQFDTTDIISFGVNPHTGNVPFTISAWLNLPAQPSNKWAVMIGTATNIQAGYLGANTTAYTFGTHGRDITSGISVNTGFHLFAMTYSNNIFFAVHDGVRTGNVGNAITLGSAVITCSSYYAITGIVDEFRVSKIARSDVWSITEYTNQNSPDTFYAVGAQEAQPYVPQFKPYWAIQRVNMIGRGY